MLLALQLLLAQEILGTFDTLYYHEYRLRLPRQANARNELQIHALRDFVYAILFGAIGWITWDGPLAWVFVFLLLVEIPDPRSQTSSKRTGPASCRPASA